MTYAANSISVRIGEATLLEGVSLAIEAGEVVAVAGPNGAGKTTLIRALAGDLGPTGDSITLDGRSIATWSAAQLARRRAVMSTDRSIAFGFSARDVALLGRMPFHGGDPTPEDHAVIDGLLEAVDCAGLAERVFGTLSTGERQRVQLARAIAQVADPDGDGEEGSDDRFLLLDEPTSSLDLRHQHVAMGLIDRQARAGRGVLAVLHDLNLAAAYADRIVLMKDARVVAEGSPVEMLRADLLEAVFDVPMLVLSHPHRSYPLVVAEPATEDGDRASRDQDARHPPST